MKFVALLLPLMILAACSDPVAKAEKRYAMVEKAGATPDELCAESKILAEAYLEAGSSEYEMKKLTSNITCNGAALNALERGGQ